MQLDQHTLEIVIMIVNFLSCAVMIVLWRINLSERGPEVWALAAAVGTAAFFAMIFYPAIGNHAIFLNNVGTLTTFLLLLEGILRFRRFSGEARRRAFIIAAIAIFALVSYFNRDYPAARYLFHDFVAFGLLASCAFFIIYRTRGMETAAHSISAFAFIVMASGFGYRWYLAFSGAIEAAMIGSTRHPFHLTLFLLGIPWTVGWTYGLSTALIYRVRRQLVGMAAQDALTGLDNRRSFDQIMQLLFRESRSADQRFILFLFDLNGFKAINDSHGHTFGDDILVLVAEAIRESIRENDFAVRFGGDEFIVLMRYQDDFDMELMLNRLRGSVERKRELFGREVQLRISIGTAVFPDDGTTMDELLSVADRRMYEEKEDRVLHSEVV
jgi:diguanylate cyclase